MTASPEATLPDEAPLHSHYADLQAEITRLQAVPLAWVRSSVKVPYANFGDALSPVVVAALSRLPVAPRAFDSRFLRITAVGTIGQGQRNGVVHVWGTGFDARRTLSQNTGRFVAPPETGYVIHALRGPDSRRACLRAGLHAPAVYGDPGWVLPRIFPRGAAAPTTELGVIPHISELAEPTPQAVMRPGLLRFEGGAEDGVRIIPTYHEPSLSGFRAKLAEILACRRVVSTSFHGLILADAYGIPCALVSNTLPPGPHIVPLPEGAEHLDHRVADFYLGAGRRNVLAIGMPAGAPTEWTAVIRAIDRHYQPFAHDPAALLEAFPVRQAIDASAPRWALPGNFEELLHW